MSYSVTVTGHKEGLADEAAQEFEEGVAARARAFVAELEGVTTAQMHGVATGTTDLLAEAGEPSSEPAE